MCCSFVDVRSREATHEFLEAEASCVGKGRELDWAVGVLSQELVEDGHLANLHEAC